MPDVSVILTASPDTSLFWRSLRGLTSGLSEDLDAEIIVVVDDQTTGVGQEAVATYGGRIRLACDTSRAGLAGARNSGAAIASANHLVFLHPGVLPTQGWLSALLEYAETHREAAVVGSTILAADGTVHQAGFAIGADGLPHHLYAGFPADHAVVRRSRRVRAVSGAGMLVKRAAFERVGGFDPVLIPRYDDVDLCLRLAEHGYEAHVCHQSVVGLHGHAASEDDDEASGAESVYRARWESRVEPDEIRHYSDDGLIVTTHSIGSPARVQVSPLLADVEHRDDELRDLLDARARQVWELLGENARLAGLEQAGAGEYAPKANGSGRSPGGGGRNRDPIRIVARGTTIRSSIEPAHRLVSIIIPVKNGANQLRELLPRILQQRTRDSLEIVAVDSGSSDDSVAVLRELSATVLSIPPETFNHGLTRNLAARHARGEVLVFLSQHALPADDEWLANLVAPLDDDPRIVGVCSRVLAPEWAGPLGIREMASGPSGSGERRVLAIDDWPSYDDLDPLARRLFVNFHTVSAAIRAQVLATYPFRKVSRFGEDVLWARDVLEAGWRLQHEPSSVVLHWHDYSFDELLGRYVDDGVFLRESFDFRIESARILELLRNGIRQDWRYLEAGCELSADELDRWKVDAVLRRAAQLVGTWIGGNPDGRYGDLTSTFSQVLRSIGAVPDGVGAREDSGFLTVPRGLDRREE